MSKMGLGKSSVVSSTWLTINNGKLVTRAQEDDEGAEKREYQDKETGATKYIYEHRYDTVFANVKSAVFDDTQWGTVFCVNLFTDDAEFQLRLNVNTSSFAQFAKRIPNIDKSLPLMIGAFKNDEGKNVLYMKQDDKKIAMAFTRDNPNGMPQAKKVTKMGKESWDYSDQEEFLYDLAKNWMPETEGDIKPEDKTPDFSDVEDQDAPF